MGEQALITDIQGYSIHDGPGIRTNVFFKGCPLHCMWCSNPETINKHEEVGFLASLCKACGKCMQACTHGAIIPGADAYRIDREKCKSCGDCVEACVYDALVKYGDMMTSEEVFKKVIRDKMFYDGSGGGVTVSGGEPLLHADFVRELFLQCKEEGVSTCIETCGCVNASAFQKVLDVTDLFLFDLKIIDAGQHREWTGVSNELILRNARMIADAGAHVLFRQPLIPGANANDENVRATAEFIKSLKRDDIGLQLMPFHRLGGAKYKALAQEYAMGEIEVMPDDEVNAVRDAYIALGVECSVSR